MRCGTLFVRTSTLKVSRTSGSRCSVQPTRSRPRSGIHSSAESRTSRSGSAGSVRRSHRSVLAPSRCWPASSAMSASLGSPRPTTRSTWARGRTLPTSTSAWPTCDRPWSSRARCSRRSATACSRAPVSRATRAATVRRGVGRVLPRRRRARPRRSARRSAASSRCRRAARASSRSERCFASASGISKSSERRHQRYR